MIDSEDNAEISGSAIFDPATSTLTLDNFSYNGGGTFCFEEDEATYGVITARINLTIKLRGNNFITCTDRTSGIHAGIVACEQVVICDDPDESGVGELAVIGKYGIVGNGTVFTARSSVVKVTADSTAIYGFDSAFIETSTLIAEGGNSAFGNPSDDPITMHLSHANVFAGENESASETAGPVVNPDNNTYKNKYVKFLPACTVTVNYCINGIDNKEIMVTKGDTFSLEKPVIDSYIFIGWFAEDTYQTAFDFTTPITADTTVYAKFADYEGDKKALQDDIDVAIKNLDDAKMELSSAIAFKADSYVVAAKFKEVQSAITTLENLYDDYISADVALMAEFRTMIENTQTEIIGLVLSGDKANAQALEELKNNLNQEISQAEKDAKVLPTTIAGGALVGDFALLFWILSKRKRI